MHLYNETEACLRLSPIILYRSPPFHGEDKEKYRNPSNARPRRGECKKCIKLSVHRLSNPSLRSPLDSFKSSLTRHVTVLARFLVDARQPPPPPPPPTPCLVYSPL